MNDLNVERPVTPNDHNFLRSHYNVRPDKGWRARVNGRTADRLFDARLKLSPGFAALKRNAARQPLRRVHIAGVDVPGRDGDLDRVLAAMQSTQHRVTVSRVPMGNRGKFANINLALSGIDLTDVDWLIVTDDDIAFPDQFLDRFLYACEAADLVVAQPAHRFHSNTTWVITQREWNSLVHTTHFVECGPVTAFHRSMFDAVLPFPETRWAWALDVIWAEQARQASRSIGIVDATPIEHLRPVAQSYDFDSARIEAEALLRRFGIARDSREILRTTGVLRSL